MSPELKIVIDFCMHASADATVRERILLYRGLAEICGNPAQAAKFRQLAFDLELADRRSREFAFTLQNPQPARN